MGFPGVCCLYHANLGNQCPGSCVTEINSKVGFGSRARFLLGQHQKKPHGMRFLHEERCLESTEARRRYEAVA
ncbi:UNVERIFIED_CONTAM: hypothetical protein K2H54_012501 [Gekko kuhli]